jgi:hypothetical protein
LLGHSLLARIETHFGLGKMWSPTSFLRNVLHLYFRFQLLALGLPVPGGSRDGDQHYRNDKQSEPTDKYSCLRQRQVSRNHGQGKSYKIRAGKFLRRPLFQYSHFLGSDNIVQGLAHDTQVPELGLWTPPQRSSNPSTLF